MNRRDLAALLGLLGLLVGGAAAFGSNDLVSAEYDVVVRPDGKAAIYESLDVDLDGRHARLLLRRAWPAPPCSTTSSATPTSRETQRVGLSITKTDRDTWDIVLAGGRSFAGTAMYFLNYGVDLASDGYIGSTTSTELGRCSSSTGPPSSGTSRSSTGPSGSCCPCPWPRRRSSRPT